MAVQLYDCGDAFNHRHVGFWAFRVTVMMDFFISYTKADHAWAQWIAWQLEEATYTTIIQAWDFRPGSNFVLEMDRAANETRSTIAVLSPDYLKAAYTHPEWAGAFSRDPKGDSCVLVPVRVRECEPRGLLGQVVYIDLGGLEEDSARDVLLAQVKGRRAKPEVKPVFPGRPPRSVPKRPSFPAATVPVQPPEESSPSIEASVVKQPTLSNIAVPMPLRPVSGLSDSPSFDLPVCWEPAVIHRAEQELTLYVGPIAKILVREAAVKARTPTDLYQLLAVAIPIEGERKAFLRRGRAAAIPSPSRTLQDTKSVLKPSQLEKIDHELTNHFGPVAKILINQALCEASDQVDFYERLAGHLPDDTRRAAFLRRSTTETH
jgi:TIR domain-containing protein